MRISLSTWRRLSGLVVIAALAAVACSAVFAIPSTAAPRSQTPVTHHTQASAPNTRTSNAALENESPVTYNMQGGTGKWSSDIPRLAQGHTVIALQEAGPLPPTNNPIGSAFTYVGSVVRSGLTIYNYVRNFGTSTRPRWWYVSFMNTDPNGHRVNLAMAVDGSPDGYLVVPPVSPGTRPSFGVRRGNTWYFTVHGSAGNNGFDMPMMVIAVRAAVQNTGSRTFVIMGDFNRDPDAMALPAGGYVYRSGRATQQSAGELDYMVSNRALRLYQGRRLDGYSSDHYPVEFGAIDMRAAGLISVGSYSNRGDEERILDVANNSSANGTHIITYDRNGGSNQLFTLVASKDGTFTIRSRFTGKCLDLNNGTRATAGDYVNEWSCQDQVTQNWRFTQWPLDPGAMKIVNTSNGLCLDVLGNKTGNGRWVGVYPCSGDINQKWTLQTTL